jgi:hypothetical protein
MQKRIRLLVALCVLFVVNNIKAQQNIYLNEAYGSYNRVRVFSNVGEITYGPDSLTVWSDNNSYTFDVPSVGSMGFREMDPWRAKLLPQNYWADFDYDIAFEESDKERVRREPLETDPASVQYDDFVEHSTWDKTVYIAYSEDSVSVTGDIDSLNLTIQGAHLTIETTAAKLKYILSGTSSDACFKLYSERKACLVLNGVNLTNPTGPVINSQLKKRLFIELPENTVNKLCDGEKYTKVKGEDQRGCIFAEGKICISGLGQLYITANKKCGIASDKYIHMMGGFIHVDANAEKGKAVYGQENVIIGGGVLRTYCSGLAGKGITSDSLLWIRGGVIKTITSGEVVWDDDEEDYSSCCGIKSDWDMDISGGEIYCLSTGTGGKGISAGHYLEVTVNEKTKKYYNGSLTIANADIYVRTTGRRIPDEKEEDGHGHKVGASASPKCIKCINKLTINSGNIYVRGSGGGAAEGLESKRQTEINGGKIRSYCTDDGLNCSGCVINGGDILICSSENDGLDAGNLKMYAGKLYAVGSWDAQMGVDTDGKTFEIYGGEITGVGARSCTPHGNCSQASVCFYLPKTYCSGVAVADADGNIITQFPTPNSYDVLCLFFTNDQIQVGKSYKILSYKDSFNDMPVVEYEFSMEEQYLEKIEEKFITLGSKKSKETTK